MVMKENEDDLSLFLEMRRRENAEKEKERNMVNLCNSDESQLDATPGSKLEVAAKINLVSSLPVRRTRIDEFLNSENDKNDYDWLLTPPGTPLFQSLEMESQKSAISQNENPKARPTALKSRLSNHQAEPTNTVTTTKGNVASRQPTFPSGQNSAGVRCKRPSSSGGSTPATPTGRPSLPAIVKSSRASTPTSRATLTSTKPTAPPARSSTPTRSTARSSTPTARSSVPASKSKSRSSTPTHKSSTPSNALSMPAPPGRSSSVPKAVPTISKTPVPSRGSSPSVKSRPKKSSEMPGFSNEGPPNLKTLPERPASTSRGRPGSASSGSSCADAVSKGQVRQQQSSSPSRGRASSGSAYKNGSSIPKLSRTHSSSDNVNPVLMGTKMVERVVNMRKLAPPKQDGHRSTSNNPTGKSSSTTESSGFGLSLSKKSLDMAMRHMDIRRSISSSGGLRPLVTNIPASSMYSVRPEATKSRTASVTDSPLATSSNASSEPSVNNNSMCLDTSDREENDLGSEIWNSYPASRHVRY